MNQFISSWIGKISIAFAIILLSATALVVALGLFQDTTGSSVAAENQASQVDACVDEEVETDEVAYVHPECHVKGDVQVSDVEQGPFEALYDSDPDTGLLLSCPQGCWIFAPYGANISEREVEDLIDEMETSGCISGCEEVIHEIWPPGASIAATATMAPQSTDPTATAVDPTATSPAPTATAVPPTPVAPTQVPVDVCEFSIPNGETRLVPEGCVVGGDVQVGTSGTEDGEFAILYDNDQETGLVTIVGADTWVFAPWGASVSSSNPQDVHDSMLRVGCGLPSGCTSVDIVNYPS